MFSSKRKEGRAGGKEGSREAGLVKSWAVPSAVTRQTMVHTRASFLEEPLQILGLEIAM